ncbi:Hydroxypyruvate reductase [Koleobacter methoxysyntrophicus]|uniref:Hydroxypyruvate reductase n=1 Tax=Koleobacter methoxysyntrophicus TaxID=2751313 RepID=A0A8A0RKZ2_9FIRM|nr:C-terminal binding protein [Koleobacter methoxysyntrophicus]QSQ08288.1 Hydroxypyruvate reductase [Koleobacter methoxysyntrophicus]
MAKYYIPVWSSIIKDIEIEKQEMAGFDAEVEFIRDREEFIKVAAKADAVITADSKIDRSIIGNLVKCKIIVRQGIGFDNIDIKAAAEKNIIVCNVPDYCTDEVSDHTIALILSLVRKVPVYSGLVKNGIWDIKSVSPIRRLSTLILGLAGFGKIAREVARKAKPFGFRIMAFDPYVSPQLAGEYGVDLVNFEDLIKESDIISIHVPLSKETLHLFDKTKFNLMKPTAYIVNTGRGPLINEKDLYEALKNNRLAGAALDVLEQEPPQKDNPLLALENVIVTPHAAFYSEESYIDLRRKAVQEVKRVLSNQPPLNQVNKSASVK